MKLIIPILLIGVVWCQTPSPTLDLTPLDPPYIRTRDPLDDVYGLGYCLDVIGFNGNFDFDNFWAHGCKRAADFFGFLDQNFIYDDDLNIIYGLDGTPQQGRCLKEKCSGNGCEFKLSLIEDGCAFIKYENDNDQGELLYYPSSSSSSSSSSKKRKKNAKCIRVGATSSTTNGPQLSRPLYIQKCRKVEDDKFKTWDVYS